MQRLAALLPLLCLIAFTSFASAQPALHENDPAAVQLVHDVLLEHHDFPAVNMAEPLSRAITNYPPPLPLAGWYHSTKQLYHEYKHLAASCPYLSLEWLSHPTDATQTLLSLRINYKPHPFKQERVLLFFGEHAREMISPETGLEFVKRLCDPALLETTPKFVNSKISELLLVTDFLIFPIVNPHGRRKVEKGEYCHRQNANGVDLNRNWGEHWSPKSDSEYTYPGKKPWDQYETVILAKAAAQFKPTIFISIHSGALHMLAPFAFSTQLAGEPATTKTAVDPPNIVIPKHDVDSQHGQGLKPVLAVLKDVNVNFCRCTIGAAGYELGYLSPGTCIDYIYNRLGTRFSFAVEIYSGTSYAKRRKSKKNPKLPASKVKHEDELTEDEDETNLMEFESENESEEDESMDEEMDQSTEEDEFQATVAAMLSQAESSSQHHDARQNAMTREDVLALPSYDLPVFNEVHSQSVSQSSSQQPPNDGDVPEQEGLFPPGKDDLTKLCLSSFNPLTKKLYDRTIDHWSRALMSFVDKISKQRPKKKEATTKNPLQKLKKML